MKSGLFLILFLCSAFLANSTRAEPYLMENTQWQRNLTSVAGSSAIFGDVNGDGKMDLAMTGEDGFDNLIFKIYINNGTAYNENFSWEQNLTGIREGSIAFRDINNDGFLDLVAMGCKMGEVGEGCTSFAFKTYTNNRTNLNENLTWEQNFSTLNYFAFTMGDVDDDGDLDLVASSENDDFSIYLNNVTSFVESDQWAENIRDDLNDKTLFRGGIILGYLDNDNLLDLILTGSAGGTSVTRVYGNNGTTFSRNYIWDNELATLQYSSLALGDFDNNGLSDLVLMGFPDSTIIYENNGSTFLQNQSESTGSMAGMYDGAIAWGDYDNDGDLDLVQSGQPGYDRVYLNNNTIFEDTSEEENVTNLEPNKGLVAWADIDNDNDLDLLISGWVNQFVKIFTNNITIPNTSPSPPSPPTNNYSYGNGQISLVWGNGSDTETGTEGLYYNLRVGTAGNKNSVVSGVYGGSSNPTAGYFGNMMQRKNITLKVDRFQPSTTYYWSVQTIDTGLKAGNWSAEQSFTTPADIEKPVVTVNSPLDGYSNWNMTVVFNVTVSDNLNLSNVSLYGNWSGGWHLNRTNSSGGNGTNYIFVSNFNSDGYGPYKWAIKACDNATNCFWTDNLTFRLVHPIIGLNENSTWQWNLSGSIHNGAVYGDIDNDGDLDLLTIGCSSLPLWCSVPDKTHVYTNNGSSFVENITWEQNLTEVGFGSLALGDIDNDGDLDLVLSQLSSTKLYTNNGTSFIENYTWEEKVIPEEGGSLSVLLGDIDNDGDLDLIFPGMSGTLNKTYLFNGISFVGNPFWSQMTGEGKVSSFLADLDNDGDLDLSITGLNSAKGYINNGNGFAYNPYWNTGIADEGSIAVGDFDNDDDMDVIESRILGTCANGVSFFMNDGNQFVENTSLWNFDMSGFAFGSLAFGDYDNDGNLDLASIGNCGSDRAEILNNNGSMFSRDTEAESNITGQDYSSVVWADVDNDGDLDLLIIRSQKVYINNNTVPNTPPLPPSPPSNNYSYANEQITLVWGNGSDSEVGTRGLYYNLKVGTASNKNSIVSGIYGGYGDAASGGITGGYFGNMMQRKNITLKVDRFQPSTTYYWSVQTIDTGLKAGNWSAEQSFTTPADIEKPVVTVNSPLDGYSNWNMTVVFNVTVSDNLNLSNVSLYGNWSGGWHLNRTNSSGVKGTYYVFSVNLNSDGDGGFKWGISACDNATNCMWKGNYTFTLDSFRPAVDFVGPTPADGANVSVASVTLNVSHAEPHPDTLILNWNGTNTSYSYSGAFTEIVKSGLSDGIYAYYGWLNDTAGNSNITSVKTLNVDLTKPVPFIASPANATYNSDPLLNFSYRESSPASCWYSLNGAGNATLPSCQLNGTVLASNEGGNYVSLFMNDSAGNMNLTFAYWTLDTTPPGISIDSPLNQSYNNLWYWANATLNENASWCGLSLNGTANVSMNNGSMTHFYYNISFALNEGGHNVTFSCNDTLGNMNSSVVRFFSIDRTAPALENVTNWTIEWSRANVSWDANEYSNASIWYGTSNASLNNNRTSSSYTLHHNIDLTELTGNTTYFYNVSSCDAAGNCNSSGILNFTTDVCTESWSYGLWSACASGQQIRSAMDANGCGTEVNKSATVLSCATNPSGGPSSFYPPLPAQNRTNQTPTNTTWYFERIRAGVETGLVLDQPGYAVTQLLITLEKDAGGVYVDVKKLGAAPSTLAKLPDGNVYQYLNITILNLSSSVIQQGRIRFEVSKAWIASNSINESTVALERYTRGEWQKLNTSIIDSTLNYSFFASETPGFSIFAITGRVLEAPESICTPGEKRCFNDTTEECCDNGIDWLLRERCAYSCSNGKCLENPYESGLMQNYLWLLVPIALVAIATIGAIFKIKRHPKIGA